MSTQAECWLIQWTKPDGTRHERNAKQGTVDIWEACRVTAAMFRCPVYFTPGNKLGRPLRTAADGQILWTRVDPGEGHAVDVVLNPAQVTGPSL